MAESSRWLLCFLSAAVGGAVALTLQRFAIADDTRAAQSEEKERKPRKKAKVLSLKAQRASGEQPPTSLETSLFFDLTKHPFRHGKLIEEASDVVDIIERLSSYVAEFLRSEAPTAYSWAKASQPTWLNDSGRNDNALGPAAQSRGCTSLWMNRKMHNNP